MSITLSAPPAIIQDVRMYAERHATSLNALIREHLAMLAAKEQLHRMEEAKRLKEFFENEKGWFGKSTKFDRALANTR